MSYSIRVVNRKDKEIGKFTFNQNSTTDDLRKVFAEKCKKKKTNI